MKRLLLVAALVALLTLPLASLALADGPTGAGNRACDASGGAAAAHADAHTNAINCGDGSDPGDPGGSDDDGGGGV